MLQFRVEGKLPELPRAIQSPRQAEQDCKFTTAQGPARIITAAPAQLPCLVENEFGFGEPAAPREKPPELHAGIDTVVF